MVCTFCVGEIDDINIYWYFERLEPELIWEKTNNEYSK
jgi:hypothetical protein